MTLAAQPLVSAALLVRFPCGSSSTPHLTMHRLLRCSTREIYLENIFSRNSKEETGQLQQNVQVQGQLAQESQVEKMPVCWCPSCSDIPSPRARRRNQQIEQHPMSLPL